MAVSHPQVTIVRQEASPCQDALYADFAAIDSDHFEQILEWARLGAAYFRVNPASIEHHQRKLEAITGTELRISEFGNWRTSSAFGPAEKLALSLSRLISLQDKTETSGLLEDAKTSFTNDQTLRLCMSIVAVNDWIDLHSPSPIRILVVEDNDDDRELLMRQLKRAGLADHVLFLRDGLNALKLFEAMGDPSQLGLVAVFLDLQLPGASGLELLRCLRRKEKSHRFPVVVMTSTNDPAAVQECERLKVDSFVQKPITFQSFAHAIANTFHSVQAV